MTPQTVLSVHNYYCQPGGEDQVFNSEASLLQSYGHTILRHEEHNARIGSGLLTALTTTWNQGSYAKLQAAIRLHKPSIAHFHNTFPLISPAAYYAVRRAGLPSVQVLQNYRLFCPGATFMREGVICEDCLGSRSLLPSIAHGCYRQSRPATAAVAAMLTAHRLAGTWQRLVDVYIAVSEFSRNKFVEAGLPADRILVKPPMVSPDPGVGDGVGEYALFVGRLAEEKGIRTLAAAWRMVPDIELRVAGDGPLDAMTWPSGTTCLGNQTKEQVRELMKNARVVIVPSIWYEIGPLTLIEAFACGTPVIASNLGSMAERVSDHCTGLLFRPGDAQDLAAKVRWAFDHPQELAAMRIAARREFEEKYTAERNYKMLLEIYERAIENSRRRRAVA